MSKSSEGGVAYVPLSTLLKALNLTKESVVCEISNLPPPDEISLETLYS